MHYDNSKLLDKILKYFLKHLPISFLSNQHVTVKVFVFLLLTITQNK